MDVGFHPEVGMARGRFREHQIFHFAALRPWGQTERLNTSSSTQHLALDGVGLVEKKRFFLSREYFLKEKNPFLNEFQNIC